MFEKLFTYVFMFVWTVNIVLFIGLTFFKDKIDEGFIRLVKWSQE